MYKPTFFLAVIIFSLISITRSYSQANTYTPTVDSLLNLINTTTGAEQLRQYPRLHKALYEVNDINVHLKFNKEFAEAARLAKDDKMEAISHVLKIEALYNYRMPDSLMLVEAFKALAFMENVPSAHVHYFYTASVVSDIYMLQGNYEKALEFAEKFYNIAKKNKNSSGLVASLQTMGKAYEELRVLDKAEVSFRESIAVANERTDHGMKGESYSFLVDMLNAQKRYNDALIACKEFDVFLKRIDAYNSEVKNLCFLGDLGYVASYTGLGKYKLAWEYLSRAEKFPVAATGLGMYSVENKRFQLLFAEGRYAEAEHSLQQLEGILENDASYFKASLNLRKSRGDLYYDWGKFEKSADAYKGYIAHNDSLQRVEMTTRLNTLRTEYEVDKLEIQKDLQQRTFQNTLLWLGLVLVLLSIILTIVIFNARKLDAKNRSLLNRIQEHDKQDLINEQIRKEWAQNNTEISAYTKEDESLSNLYFRLKELMKDPKTFTDPNINRKVIAEKLGTNEKYVFDTIKEFYGTNISEYINKLRLDYARSLLALPSDNHTVDAIALEAGFNSRSVFYRLFKERYGMTPVEFRRLVANL